MKTITMKEYNKKMDQVIDKKLSFDETFIQMLFVASEYRIRKEGRSRSKEKSKPRK